MRYKRSHAHCLTYGSKAILHALFALAVRMPRLTIAVFLLLLAALAGTLTYTGYLVVSTLSAHLGWGRVPTGLLLGVLFARLPWIRAGKLQTIGLLPKRARLPVMATLLAFCFLSFLYRGEVVSLLFVGFALSFLIFYPRLKQRLLNRILAPFSQARARSARSPSREENVIDVDFREKRD